MTAPSGLPNGTGRALAPALASQLPVKLGVTRPPIRRISKTMRPSAARVETLARPRRASSKWKATLARARARTSPATFRLRQFRPADDFARDQRGEDD